MFEFLSGPRFPDIGLNIILDVSLTVVLDKIKFK